MLHEGLEAAFVPPVIDAPRRARVRDVQALSEAEALVFFEGVEDLGSSSVVRWRSWVQ